MPETKLPTAQIKGALLRQMTTLLLDKLPDPAARAVLEHARSKVHIFDATWYDVHMATSLLDAMARVHPVDDAFCQALGRACIKALLGSVHRLLLLGVKPRLVMMHAERFFHTYYRGGQTKVDMLGDTHAKVTCTGYACISPMLWQAIAAGTGMALEAASAKDVRFVCAPDPLVHVVQIEMTWRD